MRRGLRPPQEHYDFLKKKELMEAIYIRLVTEQSIADKATHNEVTEKLVRLKILAAHAAQVYVEETP